MPLYDYDCSACGLRFEVMHGVHVDGPTACPACASDRVRKAFAAPAVHFKGSGWAKKERRATSSSGAGKATASEGQDGSSEGGGGGDGSDSGGDATPSDGSSGDTSRDAGRDSNDRTAKPANVPKPAPAASSAAD